MPAGVSCISWQKLSRAGSKVRRIKTFSREKTIAVATQANLTVAAEFPVARAVGEGTKCGNRQTHFEMERNERMHAVLITGRSGSECTGRLCCGWKPRQQTVRGGNERKEGGLKLVLSRRGLL